MHSLIINTMANIIFLIFATLFPFGHCIKCYECTSELTNNEYDPCLDGDQKFLRFAECREPSVCAAYHYQTQGPYGKRLSISRGCQALRFGATCEDIFNDLRRSDRILPGQHTCTTCSQDLCNQSAFLKINNKILISSMFLLLISKFLI